MSRIGKTIMAVVASAIMILFFAVPLWKLKDVAMSIVISIGLVAMIVNFVQDVREKDD